MKELPDMRIHHVGYLVKNMEKSRRLFEAMGYTVENQPVYDAWRAVSICFLKKDGYRIELVSPEGKDSAVGELRRKTGNSPYHICYEVNDLEKTAALLGKEHFVTWQEAHEATALGGRKVMFLINGQMGLIELLECGENNGISEC